MSIANLSGGETAMGYTLGIDIGIASVGFAGVSVKDQTILAAGVHIFEAAENPKTGASLAEPRRTKRGMRRVIRRRAVRKRQLRTLFLKHGLQCVEAIDTPSPRTGRGNPPKSPWDFRKEALERRLTDEELVRALFHIGAHRGFHSNRKGAEPNDLEGKKALAGAMELKVRMESANSRTIGAFLASQLKKRNGDGSYDNFVTRNLLREEVSVIFEMQRKLGNPKTTPELMQEFSDLAFFQRPLQSSEGMVGECTFEKGEKRAPKCSYSAELFVAWSRLNNTKIRMMNGEDRFLTQEEKQRLIDKAHALKSFSYKQARSELSLHEEERFNISYRKTKDADDSWEKIREATEKSSFIALKGYHELKVALDTGSALDWQQWVNNRRVSLDDIARIISFYDDETEIRTLLAPHGLSEAQIQGLLKITSFSKTVDLSLKVIGKILPHMEQGLTYDKACDAAGYNFNRKDSQGLNRVPPFNDVRNPVVNRALAQSRKVINAMIRTHGMPETIIVEMAREVGKPFKDRKDIEREQKKNEAYRNEAKQHAAEILGMHPDNIRGEEILKHRLWKEQEGFCPYSGVYITPEMLRDSLATQIDHIVPYSRSWDDSYMNKVLCLTDENQNKRERTPYEYLHSTSRWDALVSFATRLPYKKAERMLIENFDDGKAKDWKERALNDTRYMARLLKNHLEQNLGLGQGNRVQTRNGQLTAHLRRSWGFPDKDRRNDRHHALDAIVIACSTQGMVQELSNWNKYEAKRQNPTARPLPPKPWESFRDDAKAAMEKVFVSRMPVRKITGTAHEETIRSIREDDNGKRQIIQRKKLTSLSLGDLENLVDKERNIKLYNVLKERLEQHGGKADKAFATPIHMPTNDSAKLGPHIHAVNIVTNEKTGIPINQGLASNGDMVRVDVFKKDGKYNLVPIYVHHFAGKSLPNRAIVAFKDENEWPEMKDEDFLFSLHKNEFVKIVTKKEALEGYFAGLDRSTGNVSIRAHDSDPEVGKEGVIRTGVKTALNLEKYTVDYFGKKTRVMRETRRGVADTDDSESDEADPFQRADSAA
jgi:CRISPR-associated endonuclease Csn1